MPRYVRGKGVGCPARRIPSEPPSTDCGTTGHIVPRFDQMPRHRRAQDSNPQKSSRAIRSISSNEQASRCRFPDSLTYLRICHISHSELPLFRREFLVALTNSVHPAASGAAFGAFPNVRVRTVAHVALSAVPDPALPLAFSWQVRRLAPARIWIDVATLHIVKDYLNLYALCRIHIT